MNRQLSDIEAAFSERERPAEGNFAHCTYEKRYGGTLDGPCSECEEINKHFAGRNWREIKASELRMFGQADAQMTLEGYCYLLPAYLTSAIREPKELDVCVDHLTFRFGPERHDEFGQSRVTGILSSLNASERRSVLSYFLYMQGLEEDFGGYIARSVANLQKSPSAP